ncbi:uncharacterized protein TNCV_242971 [Trichonephila clavipes]|uniref:Uncharacterized protein n=1 Tax=Trichonephila clavipes TaxID=2585209 RepID=A0A8X6W3Y2_TRICX|nr:uncharacterized protein TNCV_242971 [Trichonephila clavipes]
MGSFHHRYPTESGEFAGSKSGFRRHRGFPISFREMHLNRAPSKNQSLRGRSFATALSKNSYRCEGLTPAPSKTQSFIAAGGFNTKHPPKRQVFLPDPLPSLIYPQMFFPFPLLSDSALLNCFHSADPIGSDAFHVKSTDADVWVHIVCFQTRCRHRNESKQNTLLMRLL